VLYCHGRKLVGDRTAKVRLQVMRVTEFQFTDDVAFYYSTSRQNFELVTRSFIDTARKWGLDSEHREDKGNGSK